MLHHVSDHKGSIVRELYTALDQIYSNGSIVSVDMDVVGVMAAYLPVVRVCTAQCLSRLCSTHTHHGQVCCHNTDYVHVNGHDRTITVILAKHCIELVMMDPL